MFKTLIDSLLYEYGNFISSLHENCCRSNKLSKSLFQGMNNLFPGVQGRGKEK